MPRTNRPLLTTTALLIGLLLLPLTAISARAANTVNITMNVPADLQFNPCAGELVNLSGDLHLVMGVTEDRAGGYHVDRTTNLSQFKGVGLVSGVAYTASTTSDDSWYVGAPFPAIRTHGDNVEYLARGSTPNFVLHFRTHVTVTAKGTATAAVDQFYISCPD